MGLSATRAGAVPRRWQAGFALGGIAIASALAWSAMKWRAASAVTPEASAHAEAASPDGAWLATCGQSTQVALWNWSADPPARTVLAELGESQGLAVHALKVAFSPDGATVAVACSDGRARLYEVEARRLLRTFAHDPNGEVALDVAFHGAIYRLSGNPAIEEMIAPQWLHMRRAVGTVLAELDYRRSAWAEHEAIAARILSGDAARAEDAASSHALKAGRMIEERLKASDRAA